MSYVKRRIQIEVEGAIDIKDEIPEAILFP